MKEVCRACPLVRVCTTLEPRNIRNKTPRLPTECMKYTCTTGAFEAETALKTVQPIRAGRLELFPFGSEDKPTDLSRCSHKRFVNVGGDIFYAFRDETPYRTGQNIFSAY